MKFLSMIAVLACIALPLHANEVEEAAPDIVGGWQLKYTTPEGEDRSPMVVVGRQHQELVAWYIAEREPEEFSKVELDGKELTFTIRPKEFEGKVKVTLLARLAGAGACTGTIKYAETGSEEGEIAFKGKRIDLANIGNKETWKLSFVTPDGKSRKADVTVISMGNGENLVAWYESTDYELPAEKVTLKGDRIEMLVSTKTAQGQSFEVNFRGVINGDQVSGDADWSMAGNSGSFPFTGKRGS